MEENNTNPSSQNGENKEKPENLTEQGKKISAEARNFVSRLLDIRPETDRESTVEAVQKDISFKGHNAWILIFSIFVASIGLNVGSTAVVIGAMLISPLMGPIVGVGMAVAINDVDTLRRSFVNLGIMVGLSVLTATLYFFISPVKAENPELVARTYPTILDVLVAIFGGSALIVGKTKKGTIASVILGVAIATALMPPLCTVGYGLANGKWEFALGAIYLFSINAVFIALSTFVVVKLLGFPLVKYANSQRRRRIAQIASVVAIIVMIPSVILFVKLLSKQVFDSKVQDFLNQTAIYEGAEMIKFNPDYKEKQVDVYMIGNRIPQGTIGAWKVRINEIEGLEGTNLIVHQGTQESQDLRQLSSEVRSGILEDLYVNNQQVMADKDKRIELLENELSRYRGDLINFSELGKEIRINYQNIEEVGYSNLLQNNFKKIDTIPTILVRWNKTLSNRQIQAEQQKFKEWLDVRLGLDTLVVQRID